MTLILREVSATRKLNAPDCRDAVRPQCAGDRAPASTVHMLHFQVPESRDALHYVSVMRSIRVAHVPSTLLLYFRVSRRSATARARSCPRKKVLDNHDLRKWYAGGTKGKACTYLTKLNGGNTCCTRLNSKASSLKSGSREWCVAERSLRSPPLFSPALGIRCCSISSWLSTWSSHLT